MELLPCPFCGSVDLVLSPVLDDESAVAVSCRTCCCDGPLSISEEQATEHWNQRYFTNIHDATRRQAMILHESEAAYTVKTQPIDASSLSVVVPLKKPD
jgi:Lar family restriction alleviation protein